MADADAPPGFTVIPHNGAWVMAGPHFSVGGFETREDAHSWLLEFFDANARRVMDLEQERMMDAARLALEREEMLIRSLEPKASQ